MSTILRSALLAGLCVIVVYMPLAITPFLQDDYVFLYKAQQQAAAGEWLAWLTETSAQGTFWRPVSVGLYWLLVVTVLGSSALAAHVVNAILLGCTSAAGGVLASQLADLSDADDKTKSQAAFWATLLFGINGCWLLPVVWTCAVQETFAILFSSLALISWVKLVRSPPDRRKVFNAVASIVFLSLALLSKEGAVVVPLLAGVIAVRSNARFKSAVFVTAVAGFAVTAAWLFLRSALTNVAPESPYAPTLGANILKNALAMGLFMLNFPREAIAGWLQSHSLPLLIWGVLCFSLQLAAVSGFIWIARRRLPWKMLLIWVIIAILPYLTLRSQSYPYYACLALLAYPCLIASTIAVNRAGFKIFKGLALASSALLYVAEPMLSQPAPIARARWAEAALDNLAKGKPSDLLPPVTVIIKSESAYAAGGYLAGPAAALDWTQAFLSEDDRHTSPGSHILQVNMNGYNWVDR